MPLRYSKMLALLLLASLVAGHSQAQGLDLKALTQQPISTWNASYYDSARAAEHLIGYVNRAGLAAFRAGKWYQENYAQYQPELAPLRPVLHKLRQTDILVYMATWCGDSKREVPRLYKILDAAGVGDARLRLISLYGNKQGPQHEEAGQHIHHVATIILVQNGHELGRIIEAPQHSLEADLAAILSGEHYAPKYVFSEGLAQLIDQGPAVLSKELATYVSNNYMRLRGVGEFATYGNVLRLAGRHAEASLLLEHASKEYNDPLLYEALAEVYLAMRKTADAKNCLNDALRIRAQQADALRQRLAAVPAGGHK